MNFFVTNDATAYDPTPLSMRCPACGQNATFQRAGPVNDICWVTPDRTSALVNHRAGMRKCPNAKCQALVFMVEIANEVVISYPAETIDFDATNLPKEILSTFEEAISCHAAGCYRASALMVRRTLEELCEDKSAKGGNLKQRIAALSSNVVIPSQLLSAADELRLLGNDAAHIEAREYDKIGENEAALAIELTKELLKAVYQYDSLISKLLDLKSSKGQP